MLEDDMLRIDAHVHYNGDHEDCLALLERLDLKLLNVSVAHGPDDPWRDRAEAFRTLAQAYPDRYAWCTTFDQPDGSTDYAERVIAGLEEDLRMGATACKVWKNIGMSARKPSGEFLMVDDPIFDPIYTYLARSGRTLLMHIGEPLACWQPLDERDPHYAYYSMHPEWHMYGRAGYPSHAELIAARDRVLAKFPELRVVGAHLGSLEYDVGEVAKRLERYPNFVVDTSARTKDLACQDREAVRAFFEAYPDRVLFGTDIVIRNSHRAMPQEERASALARMTERYAHEFAYYEGDGELTVAGRTVRGLGLSPKVLQRLCYGNAVRWVPGLI
jgi:predicted TIM-barrel fold metal-dependent hydrolase